MPSSWIRVDADIGGEARVARARRVLKVTKPNMIGMLVLLEIELLKQNHTGELAGIDPETLAEWAHYDGKPDTFAKALEELMVDGKIYDWDERHGVLVTRLEKDRLRKRTLREKRKEVLETLAATNERPTGHPTGRPIGSPEDVLKTSAQSPLPTERNGTVRNGTERNGTTPLELLPDSSKMRSGDLDRDTTRAPAPAPASIQASLRDEPGPAPLAVALTPETLPRDVIAFVVRFYPRGTEPKRRRDVVQQLVGLANGEQIDYKGKWVRAGSVERLERKCREVVTVAKKVIEADKAMPLLLIKLGDTTDQSAEQLQRETVHAVEEQRSTLHDLVLADAWLLDHHERAVAIEDELTRQGYPVADPSTDQSAVFTATCRRMIRESLVLTAWRDAGAPEFAGSVEKP